MLFHNRHTISIGRLAILMDSQNINLVKRVNIPVFKFMLAKAYNRLMVEIGETLNKSELHREIESGILKVKLYNKAFNLYPALIELCSLTWDQSHLDKIEEITGYKLQKLEDRKILIEEARRLQDKYKELLVEEKKEGVSFAQVIISVEIVLGMNIDRNIKLYEFEYYMKAASEKIRQLEEANKNG
jgi:hypothetical protein